MAFFSSDIIIMKLNRCLMRPAIAAKIGVLVATQIGIAIVSYSYLTYVTGSNSLLGNSINIAGKNRFLTESALVQMQYYLSGMTDKSQVEKSLFDLESNIQLLRNGGTVGNIQIDALPSNFQSYWQTIYQDYLKLKSETASLTSMNLTANPAPDSSDLRVVGGDLIAASNDLVNALSQSSQSNARDMVSTEIALGMLNISVNVVMFFTILRMLKPIKLLTRAASKVEQGNFGTSVSVNSNDELEELAQSFNKMVKSISQYSRSLEKEKAKYRDLYDFAPDLYRTVDTNGVVLDCNHAYVRALGYHNKDELLGTSIFETTAESSMGAMRDSFETWKLQGHVENREILFKRKDGSTFSGLLSATSLRHENGEIAASNTCIVDMTEINKAKQQLEQANSRLTQLDKMKTEFISVASHELRTPIQPIIGFVDLARKGRISHEKAIDVIGQQARRLLALVNDILDAALLDDDKIVLRNEVISVNEVIHTVTSGRISSESAVHLKLDLGPDSELSLEGDRSRISQVLSNLFENALKFTKTGLIEIRTRLIRADTADAIIEIFVTDTGPGIPDSMLQSMFKKFATKSVDGGAQQGTGLGLYICKKIIHAHGGSIVAGNASMSGGAIFRIMIPCHSMDNNLKGKTSHAQSA